MIPEEIRNVLEEKGRIRTKDLADNIHSYDYHKYSKILNELANRGVLGKERYGMSVYYYLLP